MTTIVISGRTRICGIMGYPVGHSFSPLMYNAAFQERALDYVYVPFAVEPVLLPAAVEAIRALELVGVNVTVPHKQAVLPLLDEISDEARLIGAVNTVINDSGCLIGDNTDGKGFLRSLLEQSGCNPAGKTALIIGAGGAARAVAVRLALSGVKRIVLYNRSKERAAELAKLLIEKTGVPVEVALWPEKGAKSLLAPTDLVVQATPVGMTPEQNSVVPLPDSFFRPGQVVFELIYNPEQTILMQRAARTGALVLNGLGMLLYQGVLSFEMWTGEVAPLEVMRESLQTCFNRRT